ncbi:gliding motility-associated C-terminal domain-containing protein, partial [Flavobacterium sp.]|uniref:T9SS type B sorting domain-containing protein n=1 Tax=Flavobacterium sp. TaxID=239 RepID=UPI0025E2B053
SAPVCAGTPATVTATPTPAGTYTYAWTVPSGATNPGNVATFTTTTAGVYSVIITNTTTTCPSLPGQTTVVINPTPTVAVTSAPVCAGTPATVTATPTPAGTYTYAWTVPSGATNPGNVATFTTTTAGVYSVIITNTTTSCPSQPGQTTLVINPLADAGNDGTLNICSNQNSVDLFNSLSGTPQTGGTWSPALTSGTGTFNPAVDASGVYTYTITGTAPCVDDTATVTVVVTPGPEAGTDNTLVICVNNPPQDLFLLLGPNAQTGGTWVPAMASGTGVFDPAVDPQGNYTYTLSGTAPCSNDSATISVTVNPIPDAGTDGTKTFCSNGAPTDLFLSLGGTPQAGGIWSPALTSGTGVFDPAVDTAGIYTYTVGSTCITPSTATVTVSITQAPNSGGIGQTLNSCPNITSLDLFTGLDGTQDAGNWSDDDATGALVNNIFNPSTVGVGTYHFTYTVVGTSPCANGTSTVTVIVNPLPNAGNAVTIAPVCTSVGTIDLNTLLTGQDAGGTWSVTTPVDISAFAAGTYTYTYSITNSCGTDTQDVQFTVLPNPIVASSNISISPTCIGLDVPVSLSGMVDGTYTLNYDLSGSNTLTNQNVAVVISGSNGSFTIPTASVPNVGTTTITFNTIQDTTTTCQVTLNNVSGTIVINPIVQIDNTNIAVSTICLGSVATVVISNATNLPDGVYQFNYSIPTGTPTTGNSGDVTITGGSGQFTVPASVFATVGSYTITINSITTTTGCSNTTEDANATFAVVAPLSAGTFTGLTSVCPSTGIMDLAGLLTGESAGGVWTDNTSQVVTSPINITGFSAATYSYTYTVTNTCGTDTEVVQFTVYANPQLTTLNISTSPTCIGTNAVVNLNGMVDGTYTLNYDLSGSNTLPAQSVVVIIAATIGSFTIPTASIPNVGTTVITFTSIVNNTTTCASTLTNVAAQLIIRPLADIDNANLSIANVCFGSNVAVNIAGAVNLPDGVCQFNYSIPGATPVAGNSGNVTITSGVGQFTIPSTSFTTAANYTLTITGIIAATGCTNTSENATATFTINPIPNTTGATVLAEATCINIGSLVTISGANSLADGTYSITYQLSGANSGTATISATFASGVATFTILGTDIVNNGDTTITITNLISTATTCGITGTVFPTTTFNVASLAEPVLTDQGNLFCGLDVPAPTIADLSANIVGTPNMIWYNASTGGIAYSATDLLVDATTYYGAVVSANGCESSRLQVTVDLTFCDVVIPDGFSPNNDGINDTFEIPDLAIHYPNFKLEIYNRYGSLVYTGNRNKENWGGTTTESGLKLGDKLLPTGVYFYILNFNDGTRKAIQGRVYLNR